MKLLKVTENEHPQLDGIFESVERISVEQLAPEVVNGNQCVRINGNTVKDYDGAFLQIPEENPVFGRVLIEMMEEAEVYVNYPSFGFFIMSKKNYLSHVLHQKNVDAPRFVTAASEKASRNIGKYLDFPFVGKKFDEMVMMESNLIEDQEDLKEFTEGVSYGEDMMIFRQNIPGDKYRIFYCNGSMVSLEDRTEGWRHSKDNLHYSNVSSDVRKQVEKAVNGIGTRYAEILVSGDKIVDINPNPDLERYMGVSGKNTFESVAELIREGRDE